MGKRLNSMSKSIIYLPIHPSTYLSILHSTHFIIYLSYSLPLPFSFPLLPSVILATGYQSNFQSFLQQSILDIVLNHQNRIKYDLCGEDIADKRVYFVGFTDRSGKLWEIREEAIRVAKDIKGKISPPQNENEEEEE